MFKKCFGNCLIVIAICGYLSSCATPQHQALRKVDVGMDKSTVLEMAGSPARKARVHGQDRWTYLANGTSSPETTYIFFQNGKVTYVGVAEERFDANLKKTTPEKQDSNFKVIGE